MEFFNRASNGFSTWNLQGALGQKKMTGGQSQLTHALKAEDLVGEAFEAAGCSDYFLRKRVYVPEQARNREIDCIGVCKDRVLVVEVKNWRGDVWYNGIRWFQKATATGKALEFEDLMAEAHFKTEALRKHFEYDHRVPIHKDCFVTCIVFTNPNVRIDPNSVGTLPYVFNMDMFKEFVAKEMSGSSGPVLYRDYFLIHQKEIQVREAAKLVPRKPKTAPTAWTPVVNAAAVVGSSIWSGTTAVASGSWWAVKSIGSKIVASTGATADGQPKLTADDRFKIRKMCGRIRTWDVIKMHNGNTVHGDVIAIAAPSAGCGYLRSDLEWIKMEWSSSSIKGLFGAMAFGTACSITIRPVESKRTLKKNKQDSLITKFRDPETGNITFPVKIQYNTNTRKNDHVVYKVPGKATTFEVSLAHIKTIELSESRLAKGVGHFEDGTK